MVPAACGSLLSFTFVSSSALLQFLVLPPSTSSWVRWWWESSAKGHRCTIAGCVPVNLFPNAPHLLLLKVEGFHPRSPADAGDTPDPHPTGEPWSPLDRNTQPFWLLLVSHKKRRNDRKCNSSWTQRPELSPHLHGKRIKGWTLQKFCISSCFRYQALIERLRQKAPVSIFDPLCGYFIS